MPLLLTVSCFSEIQTSFTFLVLAHPGSPGQRAVKRVRVCVNHKVAQPSISDVMGYSITHTHPHNGPLSGTTRVSRYQKGKTNLDFTEARDSEWQWHRLGRMQVCISLQTDNHASTPPLSFLQAGCPSCRPTNSVKALKAESTEGREHWRQVTPLHIYHSVFCWKSANIWGSYGQEFDSRCMCVCARVNAFYDQLAVVSSCDCRNFYCTTLLV